MTQTIQMEAATMAKKAMNRRAKKPVDYLKDPYTRVLIPEEEGGYSAEVLEFPGCYSCGDSADEAMANLEEAAVSWIEASLEQGHEIPAPSSHQEYSGKIALRLPAGLHRDAARMAARERTSLNQFLVDAIAARVGAGNYHDRLLRDLSNLVGQAMVEATVASRTIKLQAVRGSRLPDTSVEWFANEAQTALRSPLTM